MFSKKDCNKQGARVDRFLAPRSSLDDLRTRKFLQQGYPYMMSDMDYLQTPNFLYKKRYVDHLDKALNLKDKKPKVRPRVGKTHQEDYRLQPWPCFPRKSRSLSSTGSVLDLPTFSYALFTDLLDWGKNNVLVAALGRSYYNWSWLNQTIVSKGVTSCLIHACKIEPTKGDIIAFGTNNGFELHDMVSCKMLLQRYGPKSLPHFDDAGFCKITCLDWSPTGNAFALGCTCGVITAYTKGGIVINCCTVEKTPLYHICISPDARFVACLSVDSHAVHILTWTTLQSYCILNIDCIVTTLNWHPWRSSLLCMSSISDDSRSSLAFWNAAADRFNSYSTGLGPSHINCALFSDHTGELVLSVVYKDERTLMEYSSALVILSDPYTIVDMWDKPDVSSYNDRIRKMMFSPDGTKLATATADEDLLIWNFLPEFNKQKPRRQRKFCSLPVYADVANFGFSLR